MFHSADSNLSRDNLPMLREVKGRDMFRTLNYTILLTWLLLSAIFQVAASVESPKVVHLYSFSGYLDVPVRIAMDMDGNAYVTDSRKHRVCVLDAYGNLLRYIYGAQAPMGVAVDSRGRLYVGDEQTGSVSIFTLEGNPIGKLGTGNGQFAMPTDIATDLQDRAYVVDSRENCVKVFGENGDYLFQFGDTRLTFPTGIAIDESNDAILVGHYGAIENGTRGANVQIFDMQGGWKGSIGRYGTGEGEFIRTQGIAVDKLGRVYVTDVFRSIVQVMDYSGNALSTIGSYGDDDGQLRLPSDVAFDPYNRLWVVSSDTRAIEIFGIDSYSSPDEQTEDDDGFTIDLTAGINLISVPLRPPTEWRLSDLATHIGDDVISIVGYISEQRTTFCYMPDFPTDDPTNMKVKGGESYIVIMKRARSVTFQGTAWEGEVSLAIGMSLFAVPLQPSIEWQLGNLAEHIGEGLTHLVIYDRIIRRFLAYMPDVDLSLNVAVEGGVGYLSVMSEPKTVVFEGEAWKNRGSIDAAPGSYDMVQAFDTSVLVVRGKVLNLDRITNTPSAPRGITIQVKNQSTGLVNTVTTNANGDYIAVFADFVGGRIASAGDTIQIAVADSQWTSKTPSYTLTTEDIRVNHVVLPAIQLEAIPKKSMLLHNYPNPANPETWIPYRLSEDAEVTIEIYSSTGQRVRTLVLGAKTAGNYVSRQQAAYWDGTNEVGEAVGQGGG